MSVSGVSCVASRGVVCGAAPRVLCSSSHRRKLRRAKKCEQPTLSPVHQRRSSHSRSPSVTSASPPRNSTNRLSDSHIRCSAGDGSVCVSSPSETLEVNTRSTRL
eukprot:Gregarina_sp_Pseudo_9__5285@NODE_60_length_4714_cov_7_156364_g56_i0_p8_GENE_NODE_60_length_4714_cov_7_156364_g56_i0NODE_60_length_4714_cov_7_156364_g56_i0_p8_ORF_typecomplete_len105_score18_39Filament_head/PF04732_14/9_4_NODE_60_length_4714_cov_7_156364_g56_i020162330